MIPKLYTNRETDFSHNGIGLLSDTISCFVTEAQNGTYELELTYKVGSFLCNELVEDNIIKARANEEHQDQLFRIYYVSEEINGTITVRAEHISYDLRGNFVENLMITNVTCEQAGQQMLAKLEEPHSFTFSSDIEHTADFYNVTRYNGLESIAGSKGSLLDTFGNGAKLVRDNFKISLVKSRGKNNDVLISYAKNMTGYKRELDSTDLITKIYPFAIVTTNVGTEENPQEVEQTVVLPERFINSLNYNEYAKGKILAVDYSSEESVKDIASLRNIATKFFADTKQDEPNINYQVEFHSLYGSSEYEELNLKELEKVCMDDIVTVRDFRFGRNVEARVIKTVYDTLLERYDKIELGRFRGTLNLGDNDLNDKVEDNINKIKNMYVRFQVMDDKIESEVAKLDGDIKTSTSLWKQEAGSITSSVTDLNGKYTQLKQTVDGFDFTGMVTFSDLSSYGGTTINGSNITTGYITGSRISGGVIEGAELKTADPSTSGGVWIRQNGMQIGTTSVHFSDGRFKIEAQDNISIASGRGGIYLMPETEVSIGKKLSCNTLFVNGVQITGNGGVAVFG
ncbi:MAG: phage tail spike protein [Paraclostridium sp.]